MSYELIIVANLCTVNILNVFVLRNVYFEKVYSRCLILNTTAPNPTNDVLCKIVLLLFS